MSEARRVVALTGAGGALGEAIAVRLAEGGTALALGDLNGGRLAASARAAEAAGAEVLAIEVDVGEEEQVEGLVAAALERFGRLDGMVNNAGVLSPTAKLLELEASDWERAIRVNLMGAVHGTAAAVRAMQPRGGGSIVNTASVAGLTAWPYAAAYGATKAAVIQLTKVAAAEYAEDDIRVNCVCPGTFPSGMHEGHSPRAMETMAAKHPLGNGTAADVAGAFAYLLGDESRWTTGTALVVDGGYSAL